MATIYIVSGTCGEYSDNRTWRVAAYKEKAQAEKHAELAKVRATEVVGWVGCDGAKWEYTSDDRKPVNEYDPDMQADCTGTDYYVEECPLLRVVPHAKEQA